MEHYINYFAGSTSALGATLLLQPLDVLRTTLVSNSKTLSIPSCVASIHSRYGIRGFWRGGQVSALRVILGSGFYFAVVESLRLRYIKFDKPSQTFLSGAWIAALSRFITSTIFNPVNVLKVRMESFEGDRYRSMIDAILKIRKEEGFRGFYTGLVPTYFKDVPHSALTYGFYEFYQHIFNHIERTYTSLNFLVGFLSAFSSTCLTQPFDVVRTRMQLSYVSRNPEHSYKGVIDAFTKIYSSEGTRGLYRGLIPKLIRKSSYSGMVTSVYEILRRSLGLERKSPK
jgi:hypothetical protein